MITKSQISEWLCSPTSLNSVSEAELRELIHKFPYSEPLHWIYLKRLYDTDDVRFEQQLITDAIYISNRKALYHYLVDAPEVEQAIPELDQLGGMSGDYFAIMENDSHRSSLQQLAANLKAARLAKSKEGAQIQREAQEPLVAVETSVAIEPKAAPKRAPKFAPDAFVELPPTDFSEENAKKLCLVIC